MTNLDLVLKAVANGFATVPDLIQATKLERGQVSSALSQLAAKKVIKSTGNRRHARAVYSLAVTQDEAARILHPKPPTIHALVEAWPMPVAFPPQVRT